MYAIVLKCHIWIPHEKIGDPYFFIQIISHFRVISLVIKYHLNLVSKISQKVFELHTALIFGILIRTEEEIT